MVIWSAARPVLPLVWARGTLTHMGTTGNLVIWLQPVLGEPFTVGSTQFETVDDALGELGRALEEGASMLFTGHRPEGPDGQALAAPTLVNFAHNLAVKVWASDAIVDESGRYL
jgi:hypothetical protein